MSVRVKHGVNTRRRSRKRGLGNVAQKARAVEMKGFVRTGENAVTTPHGTGSIPVRVDITLHSIAVGTVDTSYTFRFIEKARSIKFCVPST